MRLNMKVFQSLKNHKVDSIDFKNAIIQSLYIELPEFEKDVEEMIIKSGFGNDYYKNLMIENYPNLEKIVVKKNSLKICSCEKLKIIEIEDSIFYNVKNVIIESI